MTRASRRGVYWVSLVVAAAAVFLFAGTLVVRSDRSRIAAGSGRLPTGYVDDATCADCHGSIAASFARSGMGQDWRRFAEAMPIEDRSAHSDVRQAGQLFYQAIFRNGRLFQREFRRDFDDQEFEVQTREAAYVLGSGFEGRAYIASENGYLTILPLGWYSDHAKWDLNPGYEKHNQRFGRSVAPSCMSCHNAMVAYHPGSGHAYTEPLPSGIGCQRCHGPGANHVSEKNGCKSPTEHTGQPGTLVNPAKLSVELQQDVCLQCHLLSDIAVAQPGYNRWSFRPGMRLRDVESAFHDESLNVAFRAVGHGPRSMASACYEESGGRMTCVFCHDPHKPSSEFTAETFNRRCLECHAVRGCSRALGAGESAKSGDCIACHMPKRGVSDIPHASATEHWIRRKPQATTEDMSNKTISLGLKPFWADTSNGQHGFATVEYFGSAGNLEQTAHGVAILEQALGTTPGVAEWEHHLGAGYLLLGRADVALKVLDRAIAHRQDLVDAHHLRGEALLRLGKKREAVRWFEETLARWPWYYHADMTLARSYWEAGQAQRLLEMEEKFFRRHPVIPQRLELVARALDRLGHPMDQINGVLDRAIRADGALASPHLVRAELAIRREDFGQVEPALRAALRAEPDSAPAQVLWAGYLASQGRRVEAIAEARKILAHDPNNAAALSLLQSLGP